MVINLAYVFLFVIFIFVCGPENPSGQVSGTLSTTFKSES